MEKKKAVRRKAPSEVRTFQKLLSQYPETMSGFERESLAAEAMLAGKKRKKGKATR